MLPFSFMIPTNQNCAFGESNNVLKRKVLAAWWKDINDFIHSSIGEWFYEKYTYNAMKRLKKFQWRFNCNLETTNRNNHYALTRWWNIFRLLPLTLFCKDQFMHEIMWDSRQDVKVLWIFGPNAHEIHKVQSQMFRKIFQVYVEHGNVTISVE